MSKRIFITGATGTNGKLISKALIDAGFVVVALVRDISKTESSYLASIGVQLVIGDALKYEAWIDHVGTCDYVVWLSVVWGDFSADRPAIEATLKRLSDSSILPNTKGFIFPGGVLGYSPYLEDPINNLVDEAWHINYDIPSIHARTWSERIVLQYPTVIGSSIRLGFTYSDEPQTHSGVFSAIFKRFDKENGKVIAKGLPTVGWSHVHLNDLADLYVLIINSEAKNTKGQAFNACNEVPVSNGQVADAVAKHLGVSIEWDEGGLWGIANNTIYMKTDKAKTVLNWVPKHSSILDDIPKLMQVGVYASGNVEFH